MSRTTDDRDMNAAAIEDVSVHKIPIWSVLTSPPVPIPTKPAASTQLVFLVLRASEVVLSRIKKNLARAYEGVKMG